MDRVEDPRVFGHVANSVSVLSIVVTRDVHVTVSVMRLRLRFVRRAVG
jgi:hypothetical protein